MPATSNHKDEENRTSTFLFLIHGVGLPNPDLFGDSLQQRIEELELVEDLAVEKIDWHAIVEKPETGFWGLENFKHLANLMRGLIGASARHSGVFSQRLFDCLLLFAPVIVGLWFLSATATKSYALVILGYSLIHILCVTYRDGFLSACRSVLVGLSRPIVFLVTVSATLFGLLVIVLMLMCGFVWMLGFSTQIPVIEESGELIPNLGFNFQSPSLLMTVLLAIGLVVFVIVCALGEGLIWPLKVIADIFCLMGDQGYASTLLGQVDSRVRAKNIDSHDRIIIIGHSLGSAIAVLWLLTRSSRVFANEAHLTLITMGSPNARWLATFFRRSFPKVDHVADALLSLYPNFAWLNVYRPFDPIGGKVFHKPSSRIQDMSTGQYRKLMLRAHTGYWDDPIVVNAVYEFVKKRGGEDVDEPPTSKSCELLGWKGASDSVRFNKKASVPRGLGAAFLGMLAVYGLFSYTLFWSTGHRENRTILAERGADAPGWIYRYEETLVEKEGRVVRLPHHLLVVAPDDQNPMAFRVEVDSYWKLGDLFKRGSAEPTSVQTWFVRKTAQREAVRVKYLPESPTVFDLPDLELRGGGSLEKVGFVFLGVFWSPIILFIVSGLTYAGLRVYCGISESSEQGESSTVSS